VGPGGDGATRLFEGVGLTAEAARVSAAFKALSRLEEDDDRKAGFWAYEAKWQAGLGVKGDGTVQVEALQALLSSKARLGGPKDGGAGGGAKQKGAGAGGGGGDGGANGGGGKSPRKKPRPGAR
jgi:hypothetical protein